VFVTTYLPFLVRNAGRTYHFFVVFTTDLLFKMLCLRLKFHFCLCVLQPNFQLAGAISDRPTIAFRYLQLFLCFHHTYPFVQFLWPTAIRCTVNDRPCCRHVFVFLDRLSVGRKGLDVIFVVDVSSSIGPESIEVAKQFMKMLVDMFGVSCNKHGSWLSIRILHIGFQIEMQKIPFLSYLC